MSASAAHRPLPLRPRLPRRRIMRIAAAVSLAVLTTSGLGNVAVNGIGNDVSRVDPFTGLGPNRPARGLGENFLLVGTDSRGSITPEQKRRYHLGGAACRCTDTMMLIHLSADHTRVAVVSIPRDSYAEFPPVRDQLNQQIRMGKLNAAYDIGGPGLTVQTVERMTGVHIDHYVELDFPSFMKTVDALGGVPVHTSRPLHDPKSGLDLPAGTTLLDGGRALQYVRSRYLDNSADLGRMRRQRRFVAAVIDRVTDSDVPFDPVRLGRIINGVLHSVRADKDLKPVDLISTAEAMRNADPDATEFTSVPIADLNYQVPGVGSTVRWDDARAAALFEAIRRDRPIPRATAPSASASTSTSAPEGAGPAER